MIRKVITFFDKFEDKIRGSLSHHPILYTFIGGTAMILFWRGVWHTADILQAKGGWLSWVFYEPTNMVIVAFILLATGLFVSYFIGDTILISGMKGEKKIADKTEKEIRGEEKELGQIRASIKGIKEEMDEIKDAVVNKNTEKK